MHNILKDVSVMTNIPKPRLDAIADCVEAAIGDVVWEAKQEGEQSVQIDCGFGVLSLLITETEVRCSFKMSGRLSKRIARTMESNTPLAEVQLEKLLSTRIEETYKELFNGRV